MRLGNQNIFMPLSDIRAENYSIGNNVKVAPKVPVLMQNLSPSRGTIESTTFWDLYANSPSKAIDAELHEKHVDYLLETLPKYH